MKSVMAIFSQAQVLLLLLLSVAVLLSGMGVAFAKYESRKLFSEIERLRVQRDELVVEWGRLQIELATWGEHGRVEEKALKKLKMLVPDALTMKVIGADE